MFNVKHLIPYVEDSSYKDDVSNSRANFSHPGGNDAMEKALKHLDA